MGEFGSRFVELFKAHPETDRVYIADLVKERRDELGLRFGIPEKDRFESLDESFLGKKHRGVAPVHPVGLLGAPFKLVLIYQYSQI